MAAPTPASGSDRVSPVAWLVPLAAIVAVVGGVLVWYRPIGYRGNAHRELGVEAHSWQGGAVGALAPLVLLIAGGLVLRRILSNTAAKPGKNVVRRAGVLTVIAAVVAFGAMFLSRATIVKSSVTVGGKSYTLDQLAGALGAHTYTRGTQIGFWITAAGALLALIGGVALIVVGKAAPAAAARVGFVPPPPATPFQPPTSAPAAP